jgi:acetyltransferase-like isoleucine patch superfamily enzyme
MQSSTDHARKNRDFHSTDEVEKEFGSKNTILDLNSLLISEGVKIGNNNVFYPNVIIERSADGTVSIGDDNIFYPGVYILSSAGSLRIGNKNEFGTGGCTIKANMADADIRIGDGGRYCDGVSIMGKTLLGNGSQLLGNITVQNCSLADGGTFKDPDPDARAAVLKGFGLARNIVLECGQVMNGSGNFADAPVEWQHTYHPKS